MTSYDAESSRLYLQTLDPEKHFSLFHTLNTNPLSMKWSPRALSPNVAHTRQMMQDAMPTPEKPWNERWVILLKDSSVEEPTMVGLIGVVREQEIGYKIVPEYWGRGIMSEALKMFIEMFWSLDRNKQYNELRAGADPENLASLRVLEKQGFMKTQLLKQAYNRPYLLAQGITAKSDMQMLSLSRPGTTSTGIQDSGSE